MQIQRLPRQKEQRGGAEAGEHVVAPAAEAGGDVHQEHDDRARRGRAHSRHHAKQQHRRAGQHAGGRRRDARLLQELLQTHSQERNVEARDRENVADPADPVELLQFRAEVPGLPEQHRADDRRLFLRQPPADHLHREEPPHAVKHVSENRCRTPPRRQDLQNSRIRQPVFILFDPVICRTVLFPRIRRPGERARPAPQRHPASDREAAIRLVDHRLLSAEHTEHVPPVALPHREMELHLLSGFPVLAGHRTGDDSRRGILLDAAFRHSENEQY